MSLRSTRRLVARPSMFSALTTPPVSSPAAQNQPGARRALSQLTMGFREIAEWKAQKAKAYIRHHKKPAVPKPQTIFDLKVHRPMRLSNHWNITPDSQEKDEDNTRAAVVSQPPPSSDKTQQSKLASIFAFFDSNKSNGNGSGKGNGNGNGTSGAPSSTSAADPIPTTRDTSNKNDTTAPPRRQQIVTLPSILQMERSAIPDETKTLISRLAKITVGASNPNKPTTIGTEESPDDTSSDSSDTTTTTPETPTGPAPWPPSPCPPWYPRRARARAPVPVGGFQVGGFALSQNMIRTTHIATAASNGVADDVSDSAQIDPAIEASNITDEKNEEKDLGHSDPAAPLKSGYNLTDFEPQLPMFLGGGPFITSADLLRFRAEDLAAGKQQQK